MTEIFPSILIFPSIMTALLLLITMQSVGVEAAVSTYTTFRMACGASGTLTDDEGRVWTGDKDAGNQFLNLNHGSDIPASTSVQNTNLPSSVPYLSARIFTTPASYSFPVSPGRFWLRLFFYPFPFPPFNASDAILSVQIDSITLVSNLSLSYEISSLNLAYAFREFSVNVSSNFLTLDFIPGSSPHSFALINGFEFFSMPDFFSSSSLDAVGLGIIPLPIPYSALQTMFRLNVGGQAILPSNDDLGRTWITDPGFIPAEAQGVGASVDNAISYGTLNNKTAPQDVYKSARSMTNDNQVNLGFNLTWNFTVDPNFTYYLRLHFCELVYSLSNMRVFDIFINGEMASAGYDVVAVTGAEFKATILDFALILQGPESTVTLELHPNKTSKPTHYDAILNGLEIFKINDSNGNLQGPPPPPLLAEVAVPGSSTSMAASAPSASNKMAIVGGVAGSLVAVVALGVILLCFRQQRKKGDGGKSPAWLPLPLHGGNSQSMVSKLSTTSRKSGTGSYVSSAPSNLCRHFTFAEIIEMTNNFDEGFVLGVGGFGKVYKGVLEDGTLVAVKRGNPSSEQGVTEFQTEIELLSKLRHRHLVSLIGFCEEHSEMILVYDHMANGPLRGHLYGAGLPPLSWKQRLDICIGAARGLHYLHTGAAHGIIHRDVKTTNILLDENLVAKVSDFGLSKTGPTLDHTHVSTVVKGSFGYLDPEYFRRQQLTEKSDVYSFGVVLLEVLCARPAINPTLPREQVNMAEWAMHWQKKGMLESIIDPVLAGKISKESLKKFAETAEKCLAESGLDRPAMGDILWNLEYALQLHETSAAEVDNSNPRVKELPLKAFSEVELPDAGGWEVDTSALKNHSAVFSEDSDDATPSAVFSQLVNPQGR